MTKKRKINYAELLREQQGGSAPAGAEPAATPVAADASGTSTPPDAPATADVAARADAASAAGDAGSTSVAPAAAAAHADADAREVPPMPAAPAAPVAAGAVAPPGADAPGLPANESRAAADAPAGAPGQENRRRRTADRAASPLDLATALNERLAFERRQRGEEPVPAPAPLGVPEESTAPAAGGPPREHDDADASGEHHRSSATGSDERPSSAYAAITGDTMEFAVTSVTQAIPFRERVLARLGRAEMLLFRVGRELFATSLAAVEEAVELTDIRALPEMAVAMLGVFDLRGRMIPIYSPAQALGVGLGAAPQAALVVRAGEQRMALAVDDVEDVLEIDLAELRTAPGADDADGVLLGVVRRGRDLVAVLDGEALVAACLSERVPENA